ncbi:MAG: 50S ribosomal protein L4 [Duodenibacillus sp.]|nr:50S ribosomal protein L4 [Duodenibacillus sp.]HBC70094.1 50S ribosomal protein L4 [Sutterella sp.]
MELNVLNEQGQETAKVAASDAVFGREYNESLVHQLVVAYQANARLGTRAQLNREDVHHSTKKPWRQKGTGRARSGMTSSNIWRGGGRAFPNTPNENFSQKMNKKAYRAAMASILSKLAADGRLVVVDTIAVESPKTKAFAAKVKAMGLESALIITDTVDENLFLASRNLKNVLVVEPRYADPLSLIFYDKVVVTKAAVAKLEEMLG